MAFELADEDPVYEDVASKFWEHFLYIAYAMNHRGADDSEMWDDADGFFYDVLHTADAGAQPMRVRSMEHFLYIAYAMNHRGADDYEMWDDADGFFYDVL